LAVVAKRSQLHKALHGKLSLPAGAAGGWDESGDTMNKVLLAGIALALGTGVASAADLPVKAPPVYVPPAFSWTGCYIGGNIGAAWNRTNWTDSLFGLTWGNTHQTRFIGGGQVGCNYQFNNPGLVVGVEGDFDWVEHDVNGNNIVIGPRGHTFFLSSNDTRIATLAGRFGFAVDHALFYGKAGGAWVGNDGFTVVDQTTGQAFVGDNSNTASGWMAGIGLEYAFTNNWTAKIEYDYIGLSGRTFVVPGTVIPALAGDTITSNHNVQMLKFGFNYLFSWGGPVVARY
jgi:outer membrane immunogenic protein